jgi:hypothetical protein
MHERPFAHSACYRRSLWAHSRCRRRLLPLDPHRDRLVVRRDRYALRLILSALAEQGDRSRISSCPGRCSPACERARQKLDKMIANAMPRTLCGRQQCHMSTDFNGVYQSRQPHPSPTVRQRPSSPWSSAPAWRRTVSSDSTFWRPAYFPADDHSLVERRDRSRARTLKQERKDPMDQASQAGNDHLAAEASSRSEVFEIGLANRRWMLGEQREHDLSDLYRSAKKLLSRILPSERPSRLPPTCRGSRHRGLRWRVQAPYPRHRAL